MAISMSAGAGAGAGAGAAARGVATTAHRRRDMKRKRNRVVRERLIEAMLFCAASVSVLTMIGAEFAFAPQSRGLGYQINNARQILEPKVAYAGILVAALIGVIFQAVVRQVGRAVVRWDKADKGAPVS